MRKFILLFFFLSFELLTAQEQNLSSLLSFDGEPYLAVNPKNPDNIISGWMRFRIDGKVWIAVRNSFDGGKNWGNIQFMPHTDTAYSSADVSIAFHKSGVAYLSYIDINWSDTSAIIYVVSTTDGGNKWSQPVPVYSSTELPDKPVDRPWIAVDNGETGTSGRIYLSAMTIYSYKGAHSNYVKYSDDGGMTWSGIKRVDNSEFPVGQIPIGYGALGVDRNGTLYVAYYSYEPMISPYLRLIMAKTNDVNNGFTYKSISRVYLTPGWYTYHNGYSLTANPLDSSVAIAWTDNRYGDIDILLSKSTNSGIDWSEPVRINNDERNNGVFQDKVWTNFSLDGNLSIIWRDRRKGGKGDSASADIYAVVSTDKGNSFSDNFRLSRESAVYSPLPCCNSFISAASHDSTMLAIWSDDRSGDWDVWMSKINFKNVSSISEKIISSEEQIFIYPNPVQDEFTINFINVDKVESITLSDVLGNEVLKMYKSELNYNTSNNTITIGKEKLSELCNGMYILRVIDNRNMLKKAIIQIMK
ncbi:MAG: exo-alpha-sialidase [Bacteroidetes bacterium]|nr:exo-alpha-sialidase [Bacteroidota bacterium]